MWSDVHAVERQLSGAAPRQRLYSIGATNPILPVLLVAAL